jgi:hypothetical protein
MPQLRPETRAATRSDSGGGRPQGAVRRAHSHSTSPRPFQSSSGTAAPRATGSGPCYDCYGSERRALPPRRIAPASPCRARPSETFPYVTAIARRRLMRIRELAPRISPTAAITTIRPWNRDALAGRGIDPGGGVRRQEGGVHPDSLVSAGIQLRKAEGKSKRDHFIKDRGWVYETISPIVMLMSVRTAGKKSSAKPRELLQRTPRGDLQVRVRVSKKRAGVLAADAP